VADKNFKVKSGLQVPSLTTAGPVTTDSAGNVTSSATLPITQGGTGQTTAGNALNALLPLQTSQDNKFLQTNGVSTQWTIPQQQTSTDGTLGYKVYSGTVTPSSPVTGDIWIDQTTGNGIQLVRWRKTIASTITTLTGLDDNNLILSYTAGNEQVYINGTLITRGQDYTATNGTSVVLTQAAEIGDTVEIFGNPLFSVTDVYTQSQSNSLYVSKAGFDAAGKNLIINGAFDFWQRGTSFSLASFNADRWYHIYNENISRQSFSSIPEIPGGIYFLRWVANQASYHGMQQKIENGAILMSGQQVTLSFWARSNTSTSFNLYVHSNLENDQQEVGVNFTITPTWTKYTAVFNIPVTNGTSTTRYLRFTLPFNSSTHGLDLAQVQMEIGSVPTLFSRAGGTIAGELSACQRYFIRYPAESIFTRYGVGLNYSTTLSTIMMHLPVEMRVFPSVGNTGTPSNYAINHGADAITALTSGPALAGAGTSKKIVNIGCGVASGLTAGSFGQLISNNNLNSYIDISAEL
jgi:hypothetical protein